MLKRYCFILLLLISYNLVGQKEIVNRFFYHYSEDYNADSTRIYKSIDCIYFSDSICYEFIVQETENEYFYYYSSNNSIKWNLRRIIKDFNDTFKENLQKNIYSIKSKNNSHQIFFLDTIPTSLQSYKYFIDNGKLYHIYTKRVNWKKWNKKQVHRAKENEFFGVLDYIEFNQSFVKKHI